MIVKDHWRITTAAIQLEMERIAGLLEKSVHFHSRSSAPHSIRERRTESELRPQNSDLAATPEGDLLVPQPEVG